MLSTLVSVVLLLYFGHHFADAIVPISAGSPFKSNGSAANVLVVFYTEVCSFFFRKKNLSFRTKRGWCACKPASTRCPHYVLRLDGLACLQMRSIPVQSQQEVRTLRIDWICCLILHVIACVHNALQMRAPAFISKHTHCSYCSRTMFT